MNPLLRDLFGHQFWADAEAWSALGAHPPARDDAAIRNRLHHIHLVQRVFMWAVRHDGAPFALSTAADYPSFDDLRAYARASHAEIQQMLDTIGDARLGEPVTIPWFKDPPLTLTVTEALAQSVMHSQHHRGQNATRLRDLGGTPPSTDLIVWYWKGRPAPAWPPA